MLSGDRHDLGEVHGIDGEKLWSGALTALVAGLAPATPMSSPELEGQPAVDENVGAYHERRLIAGEPRDRVRQLLRLC